MNKATEPGTLESVFAGPERRTGAARLRVGACRVEPDLDRVSGPAGETLLEPKAMAVLVYLARRPGKVVSADELIDAIWLGRPMGDNPVYRCIAQLRRALGDDPKAPAYIATVPKKGYRLIASVLAVAPDAPPDPMPGEDEPGRAEVTAPAPTPLWRSGKVPRLIMLAGLTGLAVLLWSRHPATGDDPSLPPATRAMLARTIDPAVSDLYLKARYFWRRSGTAPENLPKAFEYFERTVAADPGFGPAWSHFARVNIAMLYYRLQPRIEGLGRAREAAWRAIELDPDKGPALTVLAEVKQALEWDWQGAETAYRRALDIGSDDAGAHLSYGLFLERMGRLEEARKPLQRALELEPVALTMNTHVAGPDFYTGDYARAIAQYEKVLELDPEYVPARLFLGYAYEQQGRFQEAIESFQRVTTTTIFDGQAALAAQGHAHARAGEPEQARRVLRELTQNQGDVDPYRVALIHVGLGDLDEAFRWLDAAAEARSADLLTIRIDPRLRTLHADPRYRDLLVRMNLSPPGA